MAFNAAVSNIEDILLCMMLFGLGLVVAIVTCPVGVVSRMAARTHSVSVLVIDWKAMVAHLYSAPGLGTMAG
jgi:hypothetical protein